MVYLATSALKSDRVKEMSTAAMSIEGVALSYLTTKSFGIQATPSLTPL
jgi:hypothetical protein